MENLNNSQIEAVKCESPLVMVIAGPGSGKTKTIVNRIKYRADNGSDPQRVVCLTFTNSGAREIAERLHTYGIDVAYVGTLHGYMLRLLNQWGHAIGYRKGAGITLLDNRPSADGQESPRDALLKEIANRLGYSKLSKRAIEAEDGPAAQAVMNELRHTMKRSNMIDYDGILSEGLKLLLKMMGTAGLDFDLRISDLYVDESQDNGEIDWMICRALAAETKFYVGDFDQCQPPGTLVQMSDGTEKAIENIVAGDSVVSYERHSKVLMRTASVSEVASRPFSGPLYSVEAGGKVSRSTGNHKWLIKWLTGSDRVQGKWWATYIMRKDNNFRVGKTAFFRSGSKTGLKTNCVLGPSLRMNQEKADCVWVLRLHSTHSEAVAYEEIVSANYGLPQACFLAISTNSNYTQKAIDMIFSGVDRQLSKAVRCLEDHGRDINYPLFNRADKRTRRTVQEIHASNLLSDVMSVPVAQKYHYTTRGCQWAAIRVSHSEFRGMVHSLDVAKYHKYVSDGLVTCNSIMSFRGACPAQFLLQAQMPSTTVLTLERNYRSVPIVCQAANNLIRHNSNRIPKVINPDRSDACGLIDTVSVEASRQEALEITKLLRHYRTATQTPFEQMAVLARTNAIVDEIRATLKEMGIPVVENSSRLPRDWSLCLITIQLMMNPSNNLLCEQYLRGINFPLVELNRAKVAVLKDRQGRSLLDLTMPAPEVWKSSMESLPIRLTMAGVSPESNALVSERTALLVRPKMSDLISDLWDSERWGMVTAGGGVTVSTIHKAKGREWDLVIVAACEEGVLPSLSKSSDIEEERRLAFVAFTRARDILLLTSCRSRFAYGRRTDQVASRFLSEIHNPTPA